IENTRCCSTVLPATRALTAAPYTFFAVRISIRNRRSSSFSTPTCDEAWRAKVDAVVTRSLTGHVTMKMHLQYSTLGRVQTQAATKRPSRANAPNAQRGGNAAGRDVAAAAESV